MPRRRLAFSAEAGLLATADSKNVVTLYEVATADSLPRTCYEGAAGPVTARAFAPEGTTLAGAAMDKTIRLWDVVTGKEVGVLPEQAHAVVALAFSSDGRTMASGDQHGVVTLWDRTTGEARATLGAAGDRVFMNEVLAFSSDGRTLVVAVDRSVQLWDMDTGRRVASLEGHQGKVKCLAYSPGGTHLVSDSYDRTVWLWDVARYRLTVP
jgi:WD40 repeat protein